MDKAGNVFSMPVQKVEVTENGRFITEESVQAAVDIQKSKGVKAFVVVANMMTTMFGSVDEPEYYSTVLEREELDYFIDRKSTRLNSSHVRISYAVFCLKKKSYSD